MARDHPPLLLATHSMAMGGAPGGPPDGVYRLEPGGEPALAGLTGQGGLLSPVVVDADDARRWYAGTRAGGVWRGGDAGATWREVNDGLVYKEVWSLAQHPATGALYAGTGPPAVFTSADRGGTWRICQHLMTLPSRRAWEFPGPPFHAHVKHLGLAAADPGLVLGAVEEGGVIRSRDGGRTWAVSNDGVEFDCHAVAVMPDDPAVVLATAGTGVYRSDDGGATFTASHDGIAKRYMTPLWTHPDRPGLLLAGGSQLPPPGWRRPQGAAAAVYRSKDHGRTWERLGAGLPDPFVPAPISIVGDRDDPDAVYLGLSDGSVWASRDAGERFQDVARGLPMVTGITVIRR